MVDQARKRNAPLVELTISPEIFSCGCEKPERHENFTRLVFWTYTETEHGPERQVVARLILTPGAREKLMADLIGIPVGRA